MGILSLLAGKVRGSETARPTGSPPRDLHGQAPLAAYRSEAVIDRQIDELIGLAKGVVADGQVSQSEAEFLLRWLETNRAARSVWPAKVLYPRLVAVLGDSVLDAEEEGELLELMLQCVGGNAPARGEASMSTALPFTRPEPAIEFAQHSFCFTGKFYSGTRNWCEGQVVTRGAQIGSVCKDLDYLVVGEIGSRDWIHSTHGRKIEKVVDYIGRGCHIAIVAEQHWHRFLN
jgi:NAD-dependent DNA ligase